MASISTFRIGDPPRRGQGLRIGAVRRPPRGVPRARWTADGYFDVWFPAIAPSRALLDRFRVRALEDPAVFTRFAAAYARELARPEARQTVELIAAVARRTPLAIGCYCDDERRCHRSVLLDTIARAARAGRG
ncbi:MAG: DUF488 family protein [Vicinamibacterales bacterium]